MAAGQLLNADTVIAGATSISIFVNLRKKADNTSHTGATVADVTATYSRIGAAAVTVVVATLTVAQTFSSGGWVEQNSGLQPGLYRFDVPDAAYATGVNEVAVCIVVATCYTYFRSFTITTNQVQTGDSFPVVSTQVAQATALTSVANAVATQVAQATALATLSGVVARTTNLSSGVVVSAINVGVTVTAIVTGAVTASAIATGALALSTVLEVANGVTVSGTVAASVGAVSVSAITAGVTVTTMGAAAITAVTSGLATAAGVSAAVAGVAVTTIATSTAAATFLAQSAKTILYGTVGAGSTATGIVTSALSVVASVTAQFQGRVVIFASDTTTVGLRGCATDITTNTVGATPTLTVTSLPATPASGDTFAIV